MQCCNSFYNTTKSAQLKGRRRKDLCGAGTQTDTLQTLPQGGDLLMAVSSPLPSRAKEANWRPPRYRTSAARPPQESSCVVRFPVSVELQVLQSPPESAQCWWGLGGGGNLAKKLFPRLFLAFGLSHQLKPALLPPPPPSSHDGRQTETLNTYPEIQTPGLLQQSD